MKCSPPGYYQEFLEGLVKIDAEATRRFLVNLGSESYRDESMTNLSMWSAVAFMLDCLK